MSQFSPPPPPAPPPAQATGQLLLELRKPPGLGSASMMSPTVAIDGYPAPARWGQNAYPAPAGERDLRVSVTYLWTYGAAQLPVVIQPGQTTTVHYTPPMTTFAAGRMGLEPQPRAGMGIFWALMAFLALVLVLIVVGALAP